MDGALTANSSSSLSLCHSHSSSVGSTVPVTISRLCDTHTHIIHLLVLDKDLKTVMWNIHKWTSYFQLACWNQHYERDRLTHIRAHVYTLYTQWTGAAGLQLPIFSATKNGWPLVTRSGNSLNWQKNSWLLVTAVFNLAPRMCSHWLQIKQRDRLNTH